MPNSIKAIKASHTEKNVTCGPPTVNGFKTERAISDMIDNGVIANGIEVIDCDQGILIS